MPSRIDENGDLLMTSPSPREGIPDVRPDVFPNPQITASGLLACSMAAAFEDQPVTRPDSDESWQAFEALHPTG